MKTYVITLSKWFPVGHIRAGEPTFFKEQLYNTVLADADLSACDCCDFSKRNCDTCGYKAVNFQRKLHTIRANYPLWEKRIAEVERGDACLSIRQWSGKPYRSPQVEIARLTKEDGVGIQKVKIANDFSEGLIRRKHYNYVDIARNDGLHPDDWLDWFKIYDLARPMAIIHFTKFRY